MGNLGMPELLLILFLALLIFGPKKLPELGKQLGKGLGEFKRASNELKRTIEEEVEKAGSVEPSPARPEEPKKLGPPEGAVPSSNGTAGGQHPA